MNLFSVRMSSQNTTNHKMPIWSNYLGLRYHLFINYIGKPGPYKRGDDEYDLLAGCLA